MTAESLILIGISIFSLLMGSFLNVVIYRLPQMLEANWRAECNALLHPKKRLPQTPLLNLWLPRSFCPHCKTTIPFWHNLPLLSFIILKGRCAFCKKSISMQYPLVELTCFLLSLAAILKFGLSIPLIYALLFIWIVIAMTGIDLKHQLLPDELTLGLLWIGLIANTSACFTSINDAIFGAIFGYLMLWFAMKIFYFFTKKVGMGQGDFKLLAALGAYFGVSKLPGLLLIASVTGAVAGITYLVLTKQSKETPIPFGPFLCLSGLFILFLN